MMKTAARYSRRASSGAQSAERGGTRAFATAHPVAPGGAFAAAPAASRPHGLRTYVIQPAAGDGPTVAIQVRGNGEGAVLQGKFVSWSSVKAHVLYGEYNSGSVAGYHKKASSEPLVKGNYKIEGYGKPTDGPNGTYYRSVHAAEKKSGNKWKDWVKKGKQSTFFPDNMGETTIKETVEEASPQGEGLGKVTTGPMKNMQIKKIGSTTVFPKLGPDKDAL